MSKGREKLDWSGKQVGLWSVRHCTGYNTAKVPRLQWLCRCACGFEKEILSTKLQQGSTKSCGCHRRLAEGQAAFNRTWADYVQNSKKRNLEFSLTKPEFALLTKNSCFYCGVGPLQVALDANKHSPYLYNGIDRVNSTQGYTKSHVVTCCFVCNRAKQAMTFEQFQEWLDRVVKFRTQQKSESPATVQGNE